jgi:RNA polymerase sigma factor (sigma-70 family)
LKNPVNIAHPEVSEARLWFLFLSGEQKALSEIASLHYKALYNYGFRFSQDGEFVRDCLQELFMELWERREKLSETHFVKSYLLKALRHKMINESLRFKRFKVHDHLPFFDFVEKSVESMIVENDTLNERDHRLRLIISRLTSRQQEVIYLRFYQGMEYSQITQIMVMERQSVANLLHRSLKEIRDQWMSHEHSWVLVLGAISSML